MALEANHIALLRNRAVPFCVDGNMAFKEPWEAKAFAIVVTLSGEGLFTWSDWVDCFSAHVSRATAAEAAGEPARTYYEQWLDAAEELLVAKGVTSVEQLFARRLGAIRASIGHGRSTNG